MFKKVINVMHSLFTSNKVSDDATTDEQDENIGELFVHHLDGVTYRYLMTANALSLSKANTFVILENIETLRHYVLSWNEFFGSNGIDSDRFPKFKKV